MGSIKVTLTVFVKNMCYRHCLLPTTQYELHMLLVVNAAVGSSNDHAANVYIFVDISISRATRMLPQLTAT